MTDSETLPSSSRRSRLLPREPSNVVVGSYSVSAARISSTGSPYRTSVVASTPHLESISQLGESLLGTVVPVGTWTGFRLDVDERRLLGRIAEIGERLEGAVCVLGEVRHVQRSFEQMFLDELWIIDPRSIRLTSNGTTVVRARFRVVEPMSRFSSGLFPRDPTIDRSAPIDSAMPLIRR